ncbi:nucleolar protein [Lodderomyces elongisporus]|uniref:nucleolar protein n=1 Tax=Lodderomyces elongisporus TaxID=36914 RepID=UPI00291D911E|nr:nucleolar protein [Lodderomyces elongisporus]WLF81467.1 nucleolar protein [Lodderomyces elongisporus]
MARKQVNTKSVSNGGSKKTADAKSAKKVVKKQPKEEVEEQADDINLPSSSSEDEGSGNENKDSKVTVNAEEYELSSDDSEDDNEEEKEEEEEGESEAAASATTAAAAVDDDDSDDESSSDDSDLDVQGSLEPVAAGHKVNKQLKKASSTSKTSSSDKKSKRGVIYIGRLPSGFQESELRTYFTQFGNITQLILSRNKKTGKSKHFAHIEFDSPEVAKIAAETMDNYLLFGHLIRCQVVENPHKELFKNAGRKFKVVPVHKIVKDKHEKRKTKEEWATIVEKFEASKKRKVEELKAKGFDYDLASI